MLLRKLLRVLVNNCMLAVHSSPQPAFNWHSLFSSFNKLCKKALLFRQHARRNRETEQQVNEAKPLQSSFNCYWINWFWLNGVLMQMMHKNLPHPDLLDFLMHIQH